MSWIINRRANPDTGVTITDGTLTYAKQATQMPDKIRMLLQSAPTNSFGGATTTRAL